MARGVGVVRDGEGGGGAEDRPTAAVQPVRTVAQAMAPNVRASAGVPFIPVVTITQLGPAALQGHARYVKPKVRSA